MLKIRKYLAMLLILAMLCALTSACSREPSVAGKDKADSSTDAEEKPTLRLFTDILSLQEMWGGPVSLQMGRYTLQSMIKYFGGTPNGVKVELEALPNEFGGTYDAELAHIRVETMSGGGPDVFLLSGFGGAGIWDQNVNTLFLNPKAAMEKGLFLPLDDYIENAQFMEFEKLEPKVMEAGRNQQGQVIMPMFYRLYQGISFEPLDEERIPASWQEALESEDDGVRYAYADALFLPGFREICFDKIADQEADEILISEEELFQRAKEALGLYQSEVLAADSWAAPGRSASWQSGVQLWYQEFTPFAFHNEQGGINAAIESWCAVNINTKYPDDAFFLVDMFLSKKFLSQEGFYYHNQTKIIAREDLVRLFFLAGHNNIPVYRDLLKSRRTGVGYKYMADLARKQIWALNDACDNISNAYFTSNYDREIDLMFTQLVQRMQEGGELSDEDIRRETDKCHSTIRMMLGES